MIPIGGSQIPSWMEETQPHPVDPVGTLALHDLVQSLDVAGKSKASKAKGGLKGTMKWISFMSTFVLNHMCALIKTGVRTNKGFKDVHLTVVAKALFVHCGAEVTSTQVYNHLRKWRLRWLQVSKLSDLSGAQWCEESFTIILEVEHYEGHIMVSSFQTLISTFKPSYICFKPI